MGIRPWQPCSPAMTGGGIFPSGQGQTGIWQVSGPFIRGNPEVLAADGPAHLMHVLDVGRLCPLRMAMLIFIAIFRKNGSFLSVSAERGTSFLRKFWLWRHKFIVQFSKFACL